ncbi:MAG: hypothetical protein E6J91_16715 [Deltaproteobacteria bacterium]|nr:MAG: hypothetical protein E6J91_16715 [Deltaproteobacteria bacterium]
MRKNPGQLRLKLDAYVATPPSPPTKTPTELESDLAEFLADPDAAHVAADPDAAHVAVSPYEAKQTARRERLERASERARPKETEPMEKTSKGGPGKISAREFSALIDRAGRARDSLASCRDSEVLRESETARRAAEALRAARLKRENAKLERQRDNMIRTMLRTARSRLDNLSSRISEFKANQMRSEYHRLMQRAESPGALARTALARKFRERATSLKEALERAGWKMRNGGLLVERAG